jgi:hypothetical protein
MTDARKYDVSLADLEATVRVDPDDVVESVDAMPPAQDDPRGPGPDRDWLAAGG